MSRGIGKTQRAILDAVESSKHGYLSVVELADMLGASPRQIRCAAHALQARELVDLRKRCAGHIGLGEYGPLIPRTSKHGDDIPTAETRTVYFDTTDDDGRWRLGHYKQAMVRGGMPTGESLYVSLPSDGPEVDYAAEDRRLSGR